MQVLSLGQAFSEKSVGRVALQRLYASVLKDEDFGIKHTYVLSPSTPLKYNQRWLELAATILVTKEAFSSAVPPAESLVKTS